MENRPERITEADALEICAQCAGCTDEGMISTGGAYMCPLEETMIDYEIEQEDEQ